MSIAYIIYTLFALTASVVLWAATRALTTRRHDHSDCDQYIKQLVRLIDRDGEGAQRINAPSRRSRMALARAIYTVVSHTYGCDPEPIRRVAERNDLERLLLRQIRHSHNARRAHLLMLLSAIPLGPDTINSIVPYTQSRDHDTRISALSVTLAANPSMAIRTIAALEYDLTPFDIARIIALLRRGLLPIAYEPLLANGNRNLRMLGLAIVRNFGIEIAEKRLHNIISQESDTAIIGETIYTLASLGRPLGHTRIRERLAAMPAAQRKALCRHLTVEGYSLGAVRNLFTEAESQYAEVLINSYKRALVRTATR